MLFQLRDIDDGITLGYIDVAVPLQVQDHLPEVRKTWQETVEYMFSQEDWTDWDISDVLQEYEKRCPFSFSVVDIEGELWV